MKLLYSLDSFKPNIDGVAISIERQARAMAAMGHVVAIAAPGHQLSNYEEQDGALRIFRRRSVPFVSRRWRLPIATDADEVLARYRPDVMIGTLPFALGWSFLLSARKHGIPTVGISETMPQWLLYNLPFLRPAAGSVVPWLWRLIVSYYNKFDVIVAVTPTALRLFEQNGLDRPSAVISNGVELDQFHPRPRDAELAQRLGVPDRPVVLYTGRLDAEKRMDVWLKAASIIAGEADVHFVVVGDGSERSRLATSAIELGLDGRITFTGFLDTSDYVRVYSLASVFAITSPAELQSIVALEAAASGLPIVAANAGALPELVEEGGNGFLFPESDPREMADRVLRILHDPGLQADMSARSREMAGRHDIRRTFQLYDTLYRSVVKLGPLALPRLYTPAHRPSWPQR